MLAAIFAFVVFVRPEPATPASTRSVPFGPLRYEAVQTRPLDLANPADARLVAGVPHAALHTARGQLLFAVFVAVTNETPAPRPLATRIDLRDDAGRTFARVPLPAGNPFAYRAEIGGLSRFPAHGTPAAADLGAGGALLLYKIPRRTYENSVLELEIHDSSRPGRVAYLTV